MIKEDFEQEFIQFQNELNSFIYRIVTHREETEDIAQETYIKAIQNLQSFKGNSSLKTWVFSIATNLAKDRWSENWMDLVKDAHVQDKALLHKKFEISNNSPHGKFVMSEHLNYCFNCVSNTLLLTNQICFLLKEVYAFKVNEIMLIVNLSEGKVKHALANSRKDMKRIFENKCALINKNGTCSQCTGLNKIFNPKQDTQQLANSLKIIKEKRGKNYDQLLDLRLQMVKSIDPLAAEGFDLHNYLIENSPQWAKAQLKNTQNS